MALLNTKTFIYDTYIVCVNLPKRTLPGDCLLVCSFLVRLHSYAKHNFIPFHGDTGDFIPQHELYDVFVRGTNVTLQAVITSYEQYVYMPTIFW